jgi:rhodanese-related sulfurtransferase
MATIPFSPDHSAQTIDVQSLAQRLKAGIDHEVQLIDVREPWEVETAAIDGFVNLPLSEFATWESKIHQQLDREAETIVMCHHGIRSAQMCEWLRHHGFTNVKNLTGGIDAYSLRVDASVPRY